MIRISAITVLLGLAISLCDARADQPSAPSTSLKVASLMYQPVKWDKDANRERLEAAVRDAKTRGAQVVVTPEGALEGYLVNEVRAETGESRRELTERFNQIAEPADGPNIRYFQRLCNELRIYVVLGFLEAAEGKTFNSAIVIGPDGRIVGKYRKTHFAQGYAVGIDKGENPVGYTRGEDYPVFEVVGRKMGVMICYDRRVPKVAAELKKSGTDFIVNPAYGICGDRNRQYISDRADETGLQVLFVHPDQTVFATPDGEVRADLRPRTGDSRVFVADIQLP
ncbi:MAG: carbon-nitrogen hydrolase family protein [Pirellulaceae bacterium]|nr:carbon-nitrogen hydrolase family protein [Pirellulaceae bacterium]